MKSDKTVPRKYHYDITYLRWKPDYYKRVEAAAKAAGFRTVNSFLKHLVSDFLGEVEK